MISFNIQHYLLASIFFLSLLTNPSLSNAISKESTNLFSISDQSTKASNSPHIQARATTRPNEGNSNHFNHFVLELSVPLTIDASVSYTTRDGSAIAGLDYITTSGTAIITAGKTRTEIAVKIIGDTITEEDETFSLVLTNPKGGRFPNGEIEIAVTHTIIDDDNYLLSSLYIADSSITLREDGTKQFAVLGRYDNGSSNDITSQAIFIVADSSIISISDGKITPLKTGSTTFKVVFDGIESNTVTVTISAKVDETQIIKNSFYDQNKSLIPADASANYEADKFAVITGIVQNKANNPIENTTIKILNHSEYGSVRTDAAGKFSLPVNGGETLTVSYEKAGFLLLHREVSVPVENWATIDAVVLSTIDPKITEVDLGSDKTSLHISSPTTDERGTRETTLVFDGVTKAIVKRPDGTSQELKNIKVCATEFDQPNTMPAKLPEGTAFTYASALTLEGVEAGSEITFDKPVIIYLDNFLGFKIGEAVPVGFYNEETGKWEAADNGVVVKLLDTDNDGQVDGLDSDNNGQANDLNGDGSTSDEVAGIKDNSQYAAGNTYWRAAIPHFSTWDLNYGSDAKLTDNDKKQEDDREVVPEVKEPQLPTKDPDRIPQCRASYSYIDIQNQVYHEDIPIAGTDLSLNYSSDRVKGYQHIVSTAVSGNEIPSTLISITAKLDIAGKTYTKTLAAQTNQKVEFIWDGFNSEGKRVEGSTTGQLSIGYQYETYYLRPPSARQSFGKGSSDFTDVKAKPITKWKTETVTFNNPIQKQQVANGWSIENQHIYSGGIVSKGNGTQLDKQIALEEGLVAYYRFEGNAKDSSGNEHDGVEYGGVTYTSGIIGQAANFDGINDTIKLSTLNGFVEIGKNNPFSYSLFLKASNLINNRTGNLINQEQFFEIAIAGNIGDNDEAIYKNDLEYAGYKDWDWYSSNYNVILDKWLHLVIIYNGGNKFKSYVNGILTSVDLVGDDSGSQINKFTCIASRSYCSSAFFHGSLDELRIYNRALSEDEIKALYKRNSSANIANNNTYKIPDGSQTYIFDIDGKHLKTLDTQTEKVLTSFEYNSNNQLIAIKDRFNNSTTIQRDSNGAVSTITAPNGQVTILSIDSSNNLNTVTYEDKTNYQFAYNTGNLMTQETEPNGNQFSHEFNSNGRLTKVNDDLNGWKNYSKTGNSYSVETALGNRETLAITGLDKSNTSASGLQRSVTYADEGKTKTVKSCGIETLTHYTTDSKTGDEVTKDKTLTLPSGTSLSTAIERTYSFNEDKTTKTRQLKTSRNGKTTQIDTDYTQGISTTTSPEGRISKRYFDSNTLLSSKEEITGLTSTTYGYDTKGRLTTTTTGDREQTISYDSQGNIATLTDEAGQSTRFTYDVMGRILSSTSPTGAVQQYQYDKNGNLTVFTTATDNQHPSVFNSVNKKTSTSSPLGGTTRYDYDLEHKLTQVTYPSGKSKTNHYSNGLLTRIASPQGDTELAYNCLENILKRTVGSESIDYSYDGTLLTGLSYTGIVKQTIAMEYNNDLRLSKLSYAGNSDTIDYDKDGLLTQRGNFSISRDADNGLALSVKDNTLEIQRQYNGYAELNQETSTIKGSKRFELATSRNKLGKITTKTETIAGTSTRYDYRYNSDGRLVEVKKDGTITESYQYDANGNRGDASVNQDDQVVTYKGITYQYNSDGYLSSKQDSQGKTTYQYGIWGELQKVVLADGKVIEYNHNANHQRIAKKVNGTMTEKYLWLNLTTLLAVYDKNNNLLMRFNYADARMPISMQKGSKLYYLHYDQVGTLKLISDNSGKSIKQIDYDSYGNVLSDSAVGFSIPFGFAGGLYDQDTGLTRFGYRDYDAFSGRWTAKDPIGFAGGDGNLYGYVLGDSVNFVDEKGLWIPQLIGAILGGSYEVYGQIIKNGWNNLDWGRIAVASVTSAMGGFAKGVGSAVFLGSSGNIVNNVDKQLTEKGCINTEEALWNGFTGGVGGLFGVEIEGLGKMILRSQPFATITPFGVIPAKEVSKSFEGYGTVFGVFTGGIISNEF